MNNKNFDQAINKIMSEAKCSKELAKKSYEKSGGNVLEAIKIAKDLQKNEFYVGGGSSGICVESAKKKMIKFKNGVLIESEFFDFTKNKNNDLKEMLERNEFDANILGGNPGDKMEVIVIDRTNEMYKIEDNKDIQPKPLIPGRKLGTLSLAQIELPKKLIIDEEGDILFKMLGGNNKTSVKIKSDRTIGDFIRLLKNNGVKTPVFLSSNNKRLDDNMCVSKIANSLVVLNVEVESI
ncbi:hypothetical protein EDEG_00374 [Edhazardia aedis USNM 41457]|uniref:Uncharacterized protein n=1 Tax=Edhazardia aedis (strain USNM 41457) TaxID=1003232 RepID=J8ZQ12_EDHAE|nr:hypothetical protein EDEG_00374 [Edhazardia aedis USNM 41457]|eukprot:EJW01783.1 hypothetical protein EDEG_00374 [Edhazardia aedis USNM 41457]